LGAGKPEDWELENCESEKPNPQLLWQRKTLAIDMLVPSGKSLLTGMKS